MQMSHGCDRWGPQRLKLAGLLVDIVVPARFGLFIENGTLLGAYRSGGFIAHDDDFDFGMIIHDRKQIEEVHEVGLH